MRNRFLVAAVFSIPLVDLVQDRRDGVRLHAPVPFGLRQDVWGCY